MSHRMGRIAILVLTVALLGTAGQADPRNDVLSVVDADGAVIQVVDTEGRVFAVRRPDGSLVADPNAPLPENPTPISTLSPIRRDPFGPVRAIDEATLVFQHTDPERCVVIDERGQAHPLEGCEPAAGGTPDAAPAAAATNPTIDVMTTRNSYVSYSPGGSIYLFGSSDTYYLSDGTNWRSGAGGFTSGATSFSRVEVSGTTVRYVLQPPANGILFQHTDYDSGDHSAQGTLGVAGPLVIEATSGSTTAVLRGQLRIMANDMTQYGEPKFNFYSSVVGSVVPFEITLTQRSGVWSATTFSTYFTFDTTGRVDFASPVSVPPLTAVRIVGSNQVPDHASVPFLAVASYDGGVDKNVTATATWSVEPGTLASVAAGLLTTVDIDVPRASVTLRAAYAEGGQQVETQRVVTIVDGDSLSVTGTWPMFQADSAHTGHINAILEPATFALRWSKTVAAGRALNPVSGGDGRVFVTTLTYFTGGQALFALDARDGEILWSKEFGSVNSVNPPSYAYGNVYVQTGNHASDTWLHSFDAASGDRVFKSPHSAQWERYFAPTVVDGVVYINGGSYGGMYAFDAFAGTQKWFRGLAQYDQWTPAVDATRAYAYTGGIFSALDRQTGAVLFTIQDAHYDWNGYSMNLAPVLGTMDDSFAIHDGRLISFDLATRGIRWEKDANFTGQPSLAHGTIYAISGGRLSALDERTGGTIWSWQAPEGALSGPILLTESHALVCSASRVHAVDLLTRADAWSYPVSGHLALANDTLYVASANGTLTAIAMVAIAPATLTGLEITGPDQALESSQVQFNAVAYYDDGRVRDRTLVSQWSVSPTTSAVLDADGTMTTTEMFTPSEIVNLHASYSERGVDVTANREVELVIGVSLDEFIARNLRGAAELETQAVAALGEARVRQAAAAAVLLEWRGDGTGGDPSHVHALNRLTQATQWTRLAESSLARSLDDLVAALEALAGSQTPMVIRPLMRTEPVPPEPAIAPE